MEALSPEIAEETDGGLLELIGAADPSSPSDSQTARQALRELHRRHYGYMVRMLERFAESVGTIAIDPAEFANHTFAKAYKSAGSFNNQSGGNAERSELQVRAWLGQIAKNMALDELKKISRRQKEAEFVVFDEAPDVSAPEPSAISSEPSNPDALQALIEWRDLLKPEDQDILMTYAMYGMPTKTGRELPKQVREDLEERTGYERDNIRQKWKRLSKRLREVIEPKIIQNKEPI